MRYCERCGNSVGEDAGYCSKCGARLRSGAEWGDGPMYQPVQPQFVKPPAGTNPAPMVLGIIGVIFAVLLPIIAYPCLIIGLVLANNDIRNGQISTAGRTVNIVGLCIAVCNSILGACMNLVHY